MNKVENRVQELWDKAVAEGIKAANAGVAESKTQFDDRNKKITLGMSENERYEILKGRTLDNIPAVTDKSLERVSINNWDDINDVLGCQKQKLILKLISEFGVFGDYLNSDTDLKITFSKNNFRESYHKQKKNYIDFTKMFAVFDDVVANAIGVEVHNRNEDGYKVDPTLNAAYVLISAFRDGNFIIPVKLEIKEFKDKANGLYVAIALEKVKATEVSKQGNTENGVTQNSRSVANISIAQLFKKINPNDTQFIKYIPDKFLNNKQLEAKKQALQEETDTQQNSDRVIEENRDLIAVHNLSQEKLLKSLKLGGLAMPSIAVTNSEHTGFGDISLIFGKDTINPDVNRDNKVYSGDAWTPMFPNVEYEADSRKSKKLYESIRQTLNELIDKYPDDALSIIKHAAEQTIENVLTKTKSVKLDDNAYLSIARKFMQDYNIS